MNKNFLSMIKGMIIGIDLDNTVFDFDRLTLDIFYQTFDILKRMQLYDIKKFPLRENFPKYFWDILDNIYYADGFAREMAPISGAVKTIKLLYKLGAKIYFVTNPMSRSQTNVADKIYLINKYFPELMDNILFMSDKTLFEGDLLIDDVPRNIIGQYVPKWRRIVFLRGYNYDLKQDCVFKFDNWDYLIPMLKILL